MAISIQAGAVSLPRAGAIGYTVVDQTGAQGSCTFTLQWTPDGKAVANPGGLSISAALEEQLRPKLETAKAAVRS